MLIGGGSGGHITPLLAVAREIKHIDHKAELISVCEKGSRFASLYHDSKDIDKSYQITAGKYRRYAGQSRLQKLLDVETIALNFRDLFRLTKGYFEASRLLKKERPDAILIKGGFVAVPLGLAAARRKIPFITHDSDSSPGLANRIISRWAVMHATGMPAELYNYPAESTVYTGIPISESFSKVSASDKKKFRQTVGLDGAKTVVTVIGGSQGGMQLNEDMVKAVTGLMSELDDLGVLHIAGDSHSAGVRSAYRKLLDKKQMDKVIVKGFVNNPAAYTGAADIIVSRASATAVAELAAQKKAVIVVPGNLADAHQHKNAEYLESKGAAMFVAGGDLPSLKSSLAELIADPGLCGKLAANLHELAKPSAANELAALVVGLAKGSYKRGA